MRHLILLTGLLFLTVFASAQDRLFSQFYAAPLTLNPALTGAFDGKFRVGANYRDQWRGALENPYKTFAGALDLKWGMGSRTQKHRDAAGIGVLFYNDQVNEVDFATTQISVSGAYHKSLSSRSSQYLSLGFQVGIAQKSVNYEKLTFEDQFNGTTGYSDPTAEPLPENSFAYGDFSVGLNYAWIIKARTSLYAGAAIHHFLSPSVSFFYNPKDEQINYPDNQLFPKYSAQLSLSLPLADGIDLLPRALYAKQGPHEKIDAGSNFRFSLSEFRSLALHVGGYARIVGNSKNSYETSEVIALVGIEFNRVLFGISYDFNLNDLSNYNLGQRTLEFSVAYLGEYQEDLILCPKF
ncbi:MAG: type IX secretion system membrane protein PorP/SprF [Bacteroidetes bacterium]|nr:MAG: type IX secretion system membrane protein PorP/SprF [Bacteroidota bacterium]